MDTMLMDLRVALRRLLREKGFTSVVTVTLALAIGVNTVVFSFLNFFVLRPLPVKDPETLAVVFGVHPERTGRVPLPYRDYLEWREHARSFEGVAAAGRRTYNLTGVGEPLRVYGRAASASFFSLWGIGAFRGRVIVDADDRAGAPAVVVLSHGFWKRQLGADEAIVGRTLRLDGLPYTVIGVVTPAIEIGNLAEVDVWTALSAERRREDLDVRDLSVSARLRPGVTLDQGTAELQAIAARVARERPDTHAGWSVRALPFRRAMAGGDTWVILSLMGVAVAFVLAIACANVANLMLARATARERETALRLALGAGRGRLVRQLLTEGAMLALLGGVLGLLLAHWGLAAIRAVAVNAVFDIFVVDTRVMTFSLLTALVSPILFALVPALQSTRAGAAALKEWSAGAVGDARAGGLRGGLVVLQLTLALSLLVVAGLTVRTSIATSRLDFGFDHRHLALFRVDLPAARFGDDAAVRGFFAALTERMAALPGVRSAAAGSTLPVVDGATVVPLAVEGAVPPPHAAVPTAATVAASPTFLQTLALPLAAGRHLDARDTAGAEPVVIVSRALASRHFAGRDAVGGRIRLGPAGSGEPWRRIVGVVGDVQNPDLGQPPLAYAYVPFLQRPERAMAVVVRAEDPRHVLAAARAEVARIDPEQALYRTGTVEQLFADENSSGRVSTGLFVAFAAVALGMGAVGLYGVIAYAVNRRRREIGVRMALGAAPGDVVGMVVRQGARLAALGLALGLLVGFGIAHAVAGTLYGVGPADPFTYATVSSVLFASALVASWIPARRASRIDPVIALRAD